MTDAENSLNPPSSLVPSLPVLVLRLRLAGMRASSGTQFFPLAETSGLQTFQVQKMNISQFLGDDRSTKQDQKLRNKTCKNCPLSLWYCRRCHTSIILLFTFQPDQRPLIIWGMFQMEYSHFRNDVRYRESIPSLVLFSHNDKLFVLGA